MAAGKSGGSAGEITFLEGTSVSALAGGGVGKYRKVWPPGLRIFSYSHWVGGGRQRHWGAGAAGAMAGRECVASALGSSPPVRGWGDLA